jgi:hypothetical protein
LILPIFGYRFSLAHLGEKFFGIKRGFNSLPHKGSPFSSCKGCPSPDEGRARRGDYSDSNAQMKIRLVRTVVTKQARLIEMLRRPDGATTAELVKAIRWQVRTPPDWQPLYATASSPRRTVWRTSKPSNCGWSR